MVADPDQVIVHVPTECVSCGADLDAAPVTAFQTRQVFDLPPIRLMTVEHRAERRACSCGVVTGAGFPVPHGGCRGALAR